MEREEERGVVWCGAAVSAEAPDAKEGTSAVGSKSGKRTDIKTVLLLGAGPIVIGQACEFDYSGTQACKALRSEGYKVILANSNPATIMTDPDTADVTYIVPLTPDAMRDVIARERPDAILPTMGGQTALNLAVALSEGLGGGLADPSVRPRHDARLTPQIDVEFLLTQLGEGGRSQVRHVHEILDGAHHRVPSALEHLHRRRLSRASLPSTPEACAVPATQLVAHGRRVSRPHRSLFGATER